MVRLRCATNSNGSSFILIVLGLTGRNNKRKVIIDGTSHDVTSVRIHINERSVFADRFNIVVSGTRADIKPSKDGAYKLEVNPDMTLSTVASLENSDGIVVESSGGVQYVALKKAS